jgi:hypothetical protein
MKKLLVLLCLACGGPLPEIRSRKPSGTDTWAWNLIHRTAAQDLGCAVGELRARLLDSRFEDKLLRQSFEIAGCGRKGFYYLVSSGEDYTLVSDQELRRRVAGTCTRFDVQFINALSRAVDGCGQRLVYVYGSSGWVARN